MFIRRASVSVFLGKLQPLRRTAPPCFEPITISGLGNLSSSSSSSSSLPFPFSGWTSRYAAPRPSTTKKSEFDIGIFFRIVLLGQTALFLGVNLSNSHVMADDGSMAKLAPNGGSDDASLTGFRKIEDGSVVSNTHTVKWRIFTDNGRSLFLQGKLGEAEQYFILALQEAKEGFGERDAHVASSCNNLAEIYRVQKLFERAEPLYLDAIKILEESFGPEDVRVGAALHNLGQFYLLQRNLDEARKCYERALKIKGRILGHGHTDYADTMYHLGTVLHLQGNNKDSEALIQDSIRILEEGGLGESFMCIRRMRSLSQILLKSSRLNEVENLQRKILHIFELSKGWDSLDTVVAAESLALTLQSLGNLTEAQELMELCLRAKKNILGEYHIQVGSSMLHLARIAMLHSNFLRKVNLSEAEAELDKAKSLLDNSVRKARISLDQQNDSQNNHLAKNNGGRDKRAAFTLLLQLLDSTGLVEVTRFELQSKDTCAFPAESELALRECISFFNEPMLRSLINFPDVRMEYLSCLRHLMNILRKFDGSEVERSRTAALEELNEKVELIEKELTIANKEKKPKHAFDLNV